MLAASMLGSTSRFASPCSVLSGIWALRCDGSSAVSPCISPSTSSQGACARTSARASRIFSAEGWLLEPKLEWLSNAALGTRPKRFISSAAITVISANWAAVGS